MSRVAFITTMKAPDHPTPSGDRTFARLILAALAKGGHRAEPITTLSTWGKTPDNLGRIVAAAAAVVEAQATAWQADGPPDAILTYHNYHKAPDLIGPALADRFGLPYAIVEPSRAPRRAVGEWADHFALADAALKRADALGAVTAHDAVALTGFAPDKVLRVPPFIDVKRFATSQRDDTLRRRPVRFVAAAMLRPGRKADSVRVLAKAWARVSAECLDATLTIAGDGEARTELEPLFPSGTFAGLLARDAFAKLYAQSDMFVWPAIKEPFGFTFLEAQAAGLPVVGGRSPGVADVVVEGRSADLVPPQDNDAVAEAMITLAHDHPRRQWMAEEAKAFAASRDISFGARRIDELLAHARRHRLGQGAEGDLVQP